MRVSTSVCQQRISDIYAEYKKTVSPLVAFLDCYKYNCVSLYDFYNQFRKEYKFADLSCIDNGDFLTNITQNFTEAKKRLLNAKISERKNKDKEDLYAEYESAFDLIPLSPYVRLLELINITKSGTPYSILFGNGAGGAYTDNYYPFENKNAGKILGPDDFPIEQRISHVFTSAHNVGYPYLKYGLVWFLFFIIFIIFSFQKKNNRTPFNFYLGFILFLCISCYMGFTFQTSIAVSIFLICFCKNTNRF